MFISTISAWSIQFVSCCQSGKWLILMLRMQSGPVQVGRFPWWSSLNCNRLEDDDVRLTSRNRSSSCGLLDGVWYLCGSGLLSPRLKAATNKKTAADGTGSCDVVINYRQCSTLPQQKIRKSLTWTEDIRQLGETLNVENKQTKIARTR